MALDKEDKDFIIEQLRPIKEELENLNNRIGREWFGEERIQLPLNKYLANQFNRVYATITANQTPLKVFRERVMTHLDDTIEPNCEVKEESKYKNRFPVAAE